MLARGRRPGTPIEPRGSLGLGLGLVEARPLRASSFGIIHFSDSFAGAVPRT